MNFANLLRKNIGTIIAALGFVLLCIITLGDLGEILAEEYWASVWDNMTAISFVSIGLTVIQTAIKQGLAEQALQRGLNTERTAQKYEEHRNAIKENNERMVYLPYFLQIYNKRHTKLRKQEFLINNNYSSEKALREFGSPKLIKEYERIVVVLTASDIKWATVDVVRDKQGKILTLDRHRRNRLRGSIFASLAAMIGVTFLTGGLFFSPSTEPLWQKLVKLFTYCVAIAIGSVFTVIKEYEKGAFGVPNDLDEINQIWFEFKSWEIPEWVRQEVEKLNQEESDKEVPNVQKERTVEQRRDISSEQKEKSNIGDTNADSFVQLSFIDDSLFLSDDGK
jgi:hypothetical protein